MCFSEHRMNWGPGCIGRLVAERSKDWRQEREGSREQVVGRQAGQDSQGKQGKRGLLRALSSRGPWALVERGLLHIPRKEGKHRKPAWEEHVQGIREEGILQQRGARRTLRGSDCVLRYSCAACLSRPELSCIRLSYR